MNAARTGRLTQRSVPLIVIATASATLAHSVAARLRQNGSVVYVTHSAAGCLRVATSVAPDVVLVDAGMPRRLEHLLKAHPTSARAQILQLTPESLLLTPQRVLHAAA